MLKLNQVATDLFHIINSYGCEVVISKEELEELYQQIGKIKDEVPQKKEELHIVLLEDDYNDERTQMELSDSAYRLLRYLYNDNWFRSDNIHLIEVDKINFEKFV